MSAPQKSQGIFNSTPKKNYSRRDFLKLVAWLGLNAGLLVLGGAGYMSNVEPYWVEISELRLKLPHLPRAFDGLRLAQLSDIHLGHRMTPERLAGVLAMVKEQGPDLLALTGDFVLAYGGMTSYTAELQAFSALLAELAAQMPVVAVLGNHDYWYNPAQVQAALERGGAVVLRNSVHTLQRDGQSLHLAGLDDVYEDYADLPALLARLPDAGGALLLVHEPDVADQSAASGRFDLQLSGHSHGGQVVLPLIGPPVLPHLGKKYPSGLYRVGNMFQYTNRGLGMTVPPVRFNCRPELTLLTLESAA